MNQVDFIIAVLLLAAYAGALALLGPLTQPEGYSEPLTASSVY